MFGWLKSMKRGLTGAKKGGDDMERRAVSTPACVWTGLSPTGPEGRTGWRGRVAARVRGQRPRFLQRGGRSGDGGLHPPPNRRGALPRAVALSGEGLLRAHPPAKRGEATFVDGPPERLIERRREGGGHLGLRRGGAGPPVGGGGRHRPLSPLGAADFAGGGAFPLWRAGCRAPAAACVGQTVQRDRRPGVRAVGRGGSFIGVDKKWGPISALCRKKRFDIGGAVN